MSYKLKIIKGCFIRGVACSENSLIECDTETAADALREGVAEPADAEQLARFKTFPMRAWVDPEAQEQAPSVRVLSEAA